jgi:hypothetical protein
MLLDCARLCSDAFANDARDSREANAVERPDGFLQGSGYAGDSARVPLGALSLLSDETRRVSIHGLCGLFRGSARFFGALWGGTEGALTDGMRTSIEHKLGLDAA